MLFIQIGNQDINVSQIASIRYTSLGNVEISLAIQDGDGPSCVYLYGKEAQAFKEAWREMGVPGVNLYKVR